MKSFRHRQQPTLSHNKTAAVVFVRFDQMRFEAEALYEFHCRRFFRDEGVGTAFEKKTVALVGLNDPTNARAGLEIVRSTCSTNSRLRLEHAVRCRQASNTSANDYDAFHS